MDMLGWDSKYRIWLLKRSTLIITLAYLFSIRNYKKYGDPEDDQAVHDSQAHRLIAVPLLNVRYINAY